MAATSSRCKSCSARVPRLRLLVHASLCAAVLTTTLVAQKDDIQEKIAALRSDDEPVRRKAQDELVKLGGKAVPRLGASLAQSDTAFRDRVRETLQRIG